VISWLGLSVALGVAGRASTAQTVIDLITLQFLPFAHGAGLDNRQ
jgi:hypothetical protein